MDGGRAVDAELNAAEPNPPGGAADAEPNAAEPNPPADGAYLFRI